MACVNIYVHRLSRIIVSNNYDLHIMERDYLHMKLHSNYCELIQNTQFTTIKTLNTFPGLVIP